MYKYYFEQFNLYLKALNINMIVEVLDDSHGHVLHSLTGEVLHSEQYGPEVWEFGEIDIATQLEQWVLTNSALTPEQLDIFSQLDMNAYAHYLDITTYLDADGRTSLFSPDIIEEV